MIIRDQKYTRLQCTRTYTQGCVPAEPAGGPARLGAFYRSLRHLRACRYPGRQVESNLRRSAGANRLDGWITSRDNHEATSDALISLQLRQPDCVRSRGTGRALLGRWKGTVQAAAKTEGHLGHKAASIFVVSFYIISKQEVSC